MRKRSPLAVLIRHLMQRDVTTVTPQDACESILALFRRLRIRHAPVLENGELVGIVSERDLLHHHPASVSQLDSESGWRAKRSAIGVAMTEKPFTCHPSDSWDTAAHLMLEHRIGCLPVVEDGALIGFVTATDVLDAFTEAACGEGHSVCLMVPGRGRRQRAGGSPTGAPAPVPFAPLVACVQLGLEPKSYLTYSAPGGGFLVLLRLPDEASAEVLLREAQDAGCLLLNRAHREARRCA